MMDDLGTVIWKELKELPQRSKDSRKGGPMSLLVMVGIFGIFIPLQAGVKFLSGGQPLIFVVPTMAMIAAVIADAFAGERERHTLETLLASPLSDRAILFGKLAAAVAYGWGITMFSLLLGLVTVNLKFGQGKLLFFSAATGIGTVLGSLLMALLVASAGVLVSLRASTVRQAQQVLTTGLMVLFFAGVFAARILPREWLVWLAQTVASTSEITLVFTVAGIVLLIDLAVLAAAMARFQRSRLILD